MTPEERKAVRHINGVVQTAITVHGTAQAVLDFLTANGCVVMVVPEDAEAKHGARLVPKPLVLKSGETVMFYTIGDTP